MKRLIYPLIIYFFALACSTPNQPKCADMICTQEFRMIQVRFKDASGKPVSVSDFRAINQRTGESTVQNNEPSTIDHQGNYIVVSDADVRKLSEKGDIITVSVTNPTNSKLTQAEFIVSGGQCVCHINKVSGPEEVTLQ